jgi:2-oxoisovalerate dehydrogenase E2 component (dihydrolipoyl transacylase)
MATLRAFNLPDLGEGLTEGEILRWLVAPGETVRLNQPIVEVETAKAAVEVPSPYAGLVVTLHADEGQTVDVGAPIITVDTDPAGSASSETTPPPDPVDPVAAATDAVPTGPPAEERTSVLVGYGPRTGVPVRRARRAAGSATAPAAAPTEPATEPAAAPAEPAPELATPVLAKPPVRKFARDRGVDLATVPGTGPNGAVTRGDVEAALAVPTAAATHTTATPRTATPTAGGERRIPVRGVRRLMAQNMVASAFTAPHVTEFLTLDVTAGMAAVATLGASPEFADVRLTPLTLLSRALVLALGRHPELNASWDEANQEIVVKEQVNLGIAAATPRGLLVPVIRDAGRLSLPELARALAELTATAREGRTAPADMTGGTITITNVGVFGVDTGTPIINPGEAAILCFGVVRDAPWVYEGAVAVRKVTTLALSFDHRIVDGALGSAFLADVGAGFADPLRMLAWG